MHSELLTCRTMNDFSVKLNDYFQMIHLSVQLHMWDFSGGAVVKNLPANAGDTSSIPGPGRFPHAMEQLSPCATTTEPTCCNY